MNISGVRLLNIEPSGYANPLEDEGTLTEQEKEVKKMDKKTMTETIKDLMEKQKDEKEIVNGERPAGVYRLPKFLKPKELEKERQRLLNNTVGIVATPAAEDVKLLTPCEMYGHDYEKAKEFEDWEGTFMSIYCRKCGEVKTIKVCK